MQSQFMADHTGSSMMDQQSFLMTKRQQQAQMFNSMTQGGMAGTFMGGMNGMGMGMGNNLMDTMSMMGEHDDMDPMSDLMSPGVDTQDASASLSDSQQLLALQRQQQMLMMQQQQLQQQSQKFDNAYMGPEDDDEDHLNVSGGGGIGGGNGVNAYLAAQNAMMKRQMAELVRNQKKLKMLQDATKKAKAEAMGAQKELFGGMTGSGMGSPDYDSITTLSNERSIAQQTAHLQKQQQQLLQMQSQFAAATGRNEELMNMNGMGGMGMGLMDDEDFDMPQNMTMKQQQQWMRQKQQKEAFDMARMEQMHMFQNQFNGRGSSSDGHMPGRRSRSGGNYS